MFNSVFCKSVLQYIFYVIGKQTFEDGTVYCGEFDSDLRHGNGIISWPNGEVCLLSHIYARSLVMKK